MIGMIRRWWLRAWGDDPDVHGVPLGFVQPIPRLMRDDPEFAQEYIRMLQDMFCPDGEDCDETVRTRR